MTKIYDEEVTVTPDLDLVLKMSLVNHLVIYNWCLDILYDDPEVPFHVLKKKASKFISSNNIKPILQTAAYNELYYQYKKYQKNMRLQKRLTDIQYFTFTIGSYNNAVFTVNDERTEITFAGLDGKVLLSKPLPELLKGAIYLNFSYSNQLDSYRINLYTSN